jgi:hypothetical protein
MRDAGCRGKVVLKLSQSYRRSSGPGLLNIFVQNLQTFVLS